MDIIEEIIERIANLFFGTTKRRPGKLITEGIKREVDLRSEISQLKGEIKCHVSTIKHQEAKIDFNEKYLRILER